MEKNTLDKIAYTAEEMIKVKFGSKSIIMFGTIEYKNGMKARNSQIGDLLLINDISYINSNGYTVMTKVIGRGDTEDEVLTDYYNSISQLS